MTNPVLIFLAIAIAIIAVAILLSFAFRRTIKRDERLEDPNGNRRDGDGIATWAGIDEGDEN